MDNQTQLKKEWIFRTLDKMTSPNSIEPSLLVSVFNIPLRDAKVLLNEYNGGHNV